MPTGKQCVRCGSWLFPYEIDVCEDCAEPTASYDERDDDDLREKQAIEEGR